MQADLLSVELGDDRPQERNVVLLDLIDVAHVGHAQTKRLAVEFERHDGFEPLHELLFGRSGLDLVQNKFAIFRNMSVRELTSMEGVSVFLVAQSCK